MPKQFIKSILLMVIMASTLASCEPKSAVVIPTFSNITISPQLDTYAVGDTITCSIERLTTGSEELFEDDNQYWFYASWWFGNHELTADFQTFAQNEAGKYVATSSPIVLTEPGEVKLYFFGKLQYPNWEFYKVEIPVIINVQDTVK